MNLSVVIVTYNSEKFISRCLDSLLGEREESDFEIIVVDNASEDGTVGLIDDPQIHLIRNERNIGFARAANQGVKAAEGEKVLFLNPDTVMKEGVIHYLSRYLENNNRVGAVGCRTEDLLGEIKPSFGHFPSLSREIAWALGLRKLFGHADYPHFWNQGRFYSRRAVDWVSGACLMTRKDVLEKVGFFSEEYFMYFEDIDLCRRIKDADYEVFYLGDISIVHQFGQSLSDRRQKSTYEIESLRTYFRKYHLGQVWFLAILISLKKIFSSLK